MKSKALSIAVFVAVFSASASLCGIFVSGIVTTLVVGAIVASLTLFRFVSPSSRQPIKWICYGIAAAATLRAVVALFPASIGSFRDLVYSIGAMIIPVLLAAGVPTACGALCFGDNL